MCTWILFRWRGCVFSDWALAECCELASADKRLWEITAEERPFDPGEERAGHGAVWHQFRPLRSPKEGCSGMVCTILGTIWVVECTHQASIHGTSLP